MPNLKVLDADGNEIFLSGPLGAGLQNDGLVLEHFIRNLPAALISGRLGVDAVLPAAIQAALDAIRDRLPAALVGGRLDTIIGSIASGTVLDTIRDRLPAALVGGRLSVDVGATVLDAIIQARLGTLGQKNMAGSTPVVLPSDQVVNTRMSLDYAHQPAWISKASNVGTQDEIDVAVLGGKNELWLGLQLPAGFTGSLTIEKSLNGGANYEPLKPEAQVVDGLVTSTVVLAANVITITNPVAQVDLSIPFDSPPPRVRVTMARGSGGSGTVGSYAGAYFTRAG